MRDRLDPQGPRREAGTNTRARGTNPRATGTNPRRLGTNRSAGTRADIERVARLKRRAVARWRVSTSSPWCSTCADDGVVPVIEQGVERWAPCPTHRGMTANEADDILRTHVGAALVDDDGRARRLFR